MPPPPKKKCITRAPPTYPRSSTRTRRRPSRGTTSGKRARVVVLYVGSFCVFRPSAALLLTSRIDPGQGASRRDTHRVPNEMRIYAMYNPTINVVQPPPPTHTHIKTPHIQTNPPFPITTRKNNKKTHTHTHTNHRTQGHPRQRRRAGAGGIRALIHAGRLALKLAGRRGGERGRLGAFSFSFPERSDLDRSPSFSQTPKPFNKQAQPTKHTNGRRRRCGPTRG